MGEISMSGSMRAASFGWRLLYAGQAKEGKPTPPFGHPSKAEIFRGEMIRLRICVYGRIAGAHKARFPSRSHII